MNIDDINYMSDPVISWGEALDRCTSLEDLRELCVKWESLVPDAKQIVDGFDEQDFANFNEARQTERRGRFSGESAVADGFLSILMPEILFKVSVTANEYKVPWGLAFIQMRKAGVLEI